MSLTNLTDRVRLTKPGISAGYDPFNHETSEGRRKFFIEVCRLLGIAIKEKSRSVQNIYEESSEDLEELRKSFEKQQKF
uniref:Uncharacterized protein n=1 Tax=Acrobeloides nanus TaxID=290746 RepID=A0A914EP59_9BILA